MSNFVDAEGSHKVAECLFEFQLDDAPSKKHVWVMANNDADLQRAMADLGHHFFFHMTDKASSVAQPLPE